MEAPDSKRASTTNSLKAINQNSLHNLKLKIGYENLKENLYPDMRSTKRTCENSKRSVQIKIRKDDYTIDKMLKKAVEYKDKHSRLKGMYRENKKRKIEVESIMSNSSGNLESIFHEKNNIKKKLNSTNLKRVKSELQTTTVSSYVNDLKFKHNNMEETIVSYEKVIKQMKERNAALIKSYEDKYQNIDAEKFEFYDQINFLNNLIVEQENKIDDLEVEKELIVRKLEDDRNHYQTIQDINTLSYSKIEKQFSDESQTLFHYKMSVDLIDNEAQWVQSKVKKSKGNIKNLEKEIKAFEKKNEILKNHISELNLKLSKAKPKRRHKSSLGDSPTSRKSINVSFKII